MVASAVKITENAPPSYSRTLTEWKGEEAAESRGANIDNNVHHWPVLHPGKHVVLRDYDNAYLSMIVYCASTKYDAKFGKVKLDKDYGRASCTVFPLGFFQ